MDGFYANLPTFSTFARIIEPDAYRPLPDDWVIGIADVVGSTEAVAQGRYKAVNLAGAAVISAVSNMLGTLDFPFVFAGDGMVCAVSPDHDRALRRTLTTTLGWVRAALDLAMRATMVTVAAIRAAGFDVRVARFQASPDVTYAMFAGGGIAWAESALKSGRLAPLPQAVDQMPDLAGLSCRFRPMPARKGLILSLIVAPRPGCDPAAFTLVLATLLEHVGDQGGNPVPEQGPAWGWPPDQMELEARIQRRPRALPVMSRLAIAARTVVSAVVVRLGLPVGHFRPNLYRRQIGPNSDFRKFEDGLMMTLDCSTETADALEALLAEARQNGIADFGLHRQKAALMTCLVPDPSQAGHVHFIDGAGGGYTIAARNLKRAIAAAEVEPARP